MPIAPYILVLARTPHEGAAYIRRAELPRGRWRNVGSASSIRGIRKATVHCLPGFHSRPDRHSILAELRYAQCEWIDVEMPEVEPVDQGDGMGEQLTIDDLVSNALETEDQPAVEVPRVDAREAWLDAARDAAGVLTDADKAELAAIEPIEIAPEPPKQRRRTRCGQCGDLHFKDDACAEDLVAPINKAPRDAAPTPAAIFS